MLSGRHFRLKDPTLGIEAKAGQRTAVMVPAGAVVRVVKGPRPDDKRMVDVIWGERTLVMFTEDIERRGEDVQVTTEGIL